MASPHDDLDALELLEADAAAAALELEGLEAEVGVGAWAGAEAEAEAEAAAEGNAEPEAEAEVEAAGQDEGDVADKAAADQEPVDNSAAPEAPVKQYPSKVKLNAKVVQRIKELNQQGQLQAPIRLGAVAAPMANLDEAAALSILDCLVEEGEHQEQPTEWICSAAWEHSALAAREKKRWDRWEDKDALRAGPIGQMLSQAVVAKISVLNRSGKVSEPLRLFRLAGALSLLEPEVALGLLNELEVKAADIEQPCLWLQRCARRRAGHVLTRVASLNRGGPGRMELLTPILPDKVRRPLSMLVEAEGLKLLDDLEAAAFEVEDPTCWVVDEAEKRMTPLAKRLRELDSSGRLSAPLLFKWALEVLSGLDEKEANVLLSELQSRHRYGKKIRKPSAWIAAEAERRFGKKARKTPVSAPEEPTGEEKDAVGEDKRDENIEEPCVDEAKEEEAMPCEVVAAEDDEDAAWREVQAAFGEDPVWKDIIAA